MRVSERCNSFADAYVYSRQQSMRRYCAEDKTAIKIERLCKKGWVDAIELPKVLAARPRHETLHSLSDRCSPEE